MPRSPGIVALLLLIGLAFGGVFAGCSQSCPGIEVHGRCETTCADDACAKVTPGAKCFDNACSPPCSAGSSCAHGATCQRVETDFGTQGNFCIGGEAQVIGGTEGAACRSNAECAHDYGYACRGGRCAFTCVTHGDCGTRGVCTGTGTDDEGHAVRLCEDDGLPRGPGQFGTKCPHGTECDCPDGTCGASADWMCVSAGDGDIDAYCTKRFCTNDAECPAGDFCAARGVRIPPCEDACGVTGDSSGDCVPASDIGPGKHYQCGLGLLVNSCRHREFCSTCETDVDCLGVANQICAKDESGGKICTILCDPNLNSCPWGNAGRCGVWDPAVGKATCEHRFGSCHGTGLSCEPCVDSADCPNGFCSSSSFSGERYCVDTSVTCSCPTGTKSTCLGGGCPESPGNRTMICYGGSNYAGTSVAGLCIGATEDTSLRAAKESCWPSH